MKSVPRMPIVACGARSWNAAGLRWPTAPVTIRSAPLTRSNTERSALGVVRLVAEIDDAEFGVLVEDDLLAVVEAQDHLRARGRW